MRRLAKREAPPRTRDPGGAQAILDRRLLLRTKARGNGELPGIGILPWVWRAAEDYLRGGATALRDQDDDDRAAILGAAEVLVERARRGLA